MIRVLQPLARRLRRECGILMIEMLTAMTILAVSMAAVLTIFTAAMISLGRGAQRGTATVLVDRELEMLHRYSWQFVRLDHAATRPPIYVANAPAGTFVLDNSSTEKTCDADATFPLLGKMPCQLPIQVVSTKCPAHPESSTTQGLCSADGKKYLVYTYIVYGKTSTGADNPDLKVVKIMVFGYRGAETRLYSSYTTTLSTVSFQEQNYG
jgi:Tfp pilus assembly protein PilV